MKEIKILLNKVANVIEHNKELSILKGENFNVFQIFDMERDENKMHSRFINTLINPKGKHGRGTVFLELFLETLNIPNHFENIKNVKTKVEHSIGKVKINGMKSTGGRIDIFIWDEKKSISIENKIYASDQEKQIVRYWNYQKDTNVVFYLNLHGTEPEGTYSTGSLKNDSTEENIPPDYYCISYSETILEWLEKCQKEASDFPIIRETIKQYIITIKRLTGQLTNQKMNKNINNLIIENYESARTITSNFKNAKTSILETFLNELKQYLQDELGNDWILEQESFKKKWSKLKIKHINWRGDAKIALEAAPQYLNHETIFGLPAPRGSETRQLLESSIDEDNLQELKSNYSKESKAWYFYKTIFNLSIDNQFSKLLTENSRKDFIKDISQDIIKLAYLLEKHL